MNKARNKFIILSELTLILLLTVLLTTLNALNFTMAADDADMLTLHIARSNGALDTRDYKPGVDIPPEGADRNPADGGAAADSTEQNRPFRPENGRFGGMGPNSPEMNSSLRYFTYAFDKDGNAERIDFRMSSLTEEEAKNWAQSLQGGSTGWTNVSYRYRVYEHNGRTFVTVIDQGRELWPCYRILLISLIGGAVMILVSFITFQILGKRLFRPVEEADRKQKQFISKLENEFKMPLTVINADTETLERQGGVNDQTRSINKQVRRMTRLVRELGALSVIGDSGGRTKIDISDLTASILENYKPKFDEKGIALTFDVEPGISIYANDNAFKDVIRELISNSLKFSVSKARFTLSRHKDRIKLVQSNDAKLPDGSCDQIFDRFTMLENASGTDGAGLGLAYVKDIVRSANGRLSASVRTGIITITIDI